LIGKFRNPRLPGPATKICCRRRTRRHHRAALWRPRLLSSLWLSESGRFPHASCASFVRKRALRHVYTQPLRARLFISAKKSSQFFTFHWSHDLDGWVTGPAPVQRLGPAARGTATTMTCTMATGTLAAFCGRTPHRQNADGAGPSPRVSRKARRIEVTRRAVSRRWPSSRQHGDKGDNARSHSKLLELVFRRFH
jgi:hypothetical protein